MKQIQKKLSHLITTAYLSPRPFRNRCAALLSLVIIITMFIGQIILAVLLGIKFILLIDDFGRSKASDTDGLAIFIICIIGIATFLVGLCSVCNFSASQAEFYTFREWSRFDHTNHHNNINNNNDQYNHVVDVETTQ